jgi:hypothetical protein
MGPQRGSSIEPKAAEHPPILEPRKDNRRKKLVQTPQIRELRGFPVLRSVKLDRRYEGGVETSATSPLDIGGDQFGAGRAGEPDHRGEIAALVYRSAEGGYPGTPIYRFVDPGQKETSLGENAVRLA